MSKKRGEKYKVVSLIRDPVAHYISYFFRYYKLFGFQREQMKKRVGLKTFHFLQSNFIKIIEGEKKDYKNSYFFRSIMDFFDTEIKKNHGIDVYKYPFDHQKGYKVYENDKVKLLVIKLEQFKNIGAEALGSFLLDLTVDEFKQIEEMYGKISKIKKNTTMSRYSSNRYFKKKVKIPKDILDYFYSFKYSKHFYNKEEINGFVKKWG